MNVEQLIIKKLQDDKTDTERLVRIEVLVESLTGNGQEGLCAKRGRTIEDLKRFMYKAAGVCGFLAIAVPVVVPIVVKAVWG